jgi:hypothetical protein
MPIGDLQYRLPPDLPFIEMLQYNAMPTWKIVFGIGV